MQICCKKRKKMTSFTEAEPEPDAGDNSDSE